MAVSEQGISFVDDNERELFNVARLGEDVRSFLTQHPVGKYLHERAKLEIEKCREEALEVDLDAWPRFRGRNKLRKIQQRRDVAKAFIDFLADAIINGDQAASELEQYR